MEFYETHGLPVDSVSLSNPRMDSFEYLLLNLGVFPFGQDSFNRTGISMIAFAFSNQTFKPPGKLFGPYVFNGDIYDHFSGNSHSAELN